MIASALEFVRYGWRRFMAYLDYKQRHDAPFDRVSRVWMERAQ